MFCEGERTEPDYIGALKQLPEVRATRAITVDVDIRHGQPMELVEMAMNRTGDEIDEVWCIFDVEAPTPHEHLHRAIESADRNGILLARSNPCFELWLLLHDGDENGYLTTEAAERKSRARDGRAGKSIDGSRYVPRRNEAIRRADILAVRHARNDVAQLDDNPSSTVGELVKSIDPAWEPHRR